MPLLKAPRFLGKNNYLRSKLCKDASNGNEDSGGTCCQWRAETSGCPDNSYEIS